MSTYKVVLHDDEEPGQHTTADIFGALPNIFSWWVSVDLDWDVSKDAPDGWSASVTIENPNEGPATITKTVNHSVIMEAVGKIVADEVLHTSDKCRRECRNLLFDLDSLDYDSDTADEVLQVAVLGEAPYS